MAMSAIPGLLVYAVSCKHVSKYQTDDLKDPISYLFHAIVMLVSLMPRKPTYEVSLNGKLL
jgi:hypothetical protein